MLRLSLLLLVAFCGSGPAVAAPPEQAGRPARLLVLDDCDEVYEGKDRYQDALTLFGSDGKTAFRISDFNHTQSIGSSREVAADRQRGRVWAIDAVARRIRRFDDSGRETLVIPGVEGSAIAVDPESGNLWLAASQGRIGTGRIEVYDGDGKLVAAHPVTGWDLVYDPKGQAFWVADRRLAKVGAKTGEVLLSTEIAAWCASSLDVDPSDGSVWVTVRRHSNVAASRNRLLKFDAEARRTVAIDLGAEVPFKVSADPSDGGAWVAYIKSGVERFSADGESEGGFPFEALAVQADPAGGAWVVTPTEVQKFDRGWNVLWRASHAGRTSQAWTALLD